MALRFDVPPLQIAAGIAVTVAGASGNGITVTVTADRVALTQPEEDINDSA